jgi:transposase
MKEDAAVYSCYEAGRDGFWIHHMLSGGGVTNLVVDSASIEVKRRSKQVKTDRLDAGKLLLMLLRYWLHGETSLWSVVRVPSPEAEASRRLHRNVDRLKKEKRSHQTRIRSLLALYGLKPQRLPTDWSDVTDWAGQPLPTELIQELEQEQARLSLIMTQLMGVEKIRNDRTKVARKAEAAGDEPASDRWSVKLPRLKSVGAETAWILDHEFFGWREFQNRRQVGAASGLTGCPYNSGDSQKEQGISKAGNARVRHLMVELAWRWLRYQPQSALSLWYQQRFGSGTRRMRRIGIVALARKLLIALWKYGAHDQIPEGAIVVS